MMKRRLLVAGFAAATSLMALAMPVLAHGDHDARPLARNLQAGPYFISLWQVYPDAGAAITPHLIVMFDGRAATPSEAHVTVAVNSTPTEVQPSMTTANGLETTQGVAERDVVTVTISDGTQAWNLEPVVVPPAPTQLLPMKELILASILLTFRIAWWAAGRTARAWRKPVGNAI
jgi:hypothetical protein